MSETVDHTPYPMPEQAPTPDVNEQIAYWTTALSDASHAVYVAQRNLERLYPLREDV